MNKDLAAFTICKLLSGSTYNVIPRTALMEGSIRYFDTEVKAKLIERITTLTKSICEGFSWKYNLNFVDLYPPLINSEVQTNIVKNICLLELGEDNIINSIEIPLFASDDFSYFLNEKPGAYILLNNIKSGESPKMCHSPFMNFNDNIISTGAYLNIRISENRLGAKIL